MKNSAFCSADFSVYIVIQAPPEKERAMRMEALVAKKSFDESETLKTLKRFDYAETELLLGVYLSTFRLANSNRRSHSMDLNHEFMSNIRRANKKHGMFRGLLGKCKEAKESGFLLKVVNRKWINLPENNKAKYFASDDMYALQP